VQRALGQDQAEAEKSAALWPQLLPISILTPLLRLQRALLQLLGVVSLCLASTAHAAVAQIAVAANFAEPMAALAKELKASTGHDLRIAIGPSGSLYAQIVNGAPFDVFLSADQERPTALEKSGHCVAGSQFTYAEGQLALWSPRPGLNLVKGEGLLLEQVGKVAMANPKLAPYGLAAQQSMRSLGIDAAIRSKLVRGNSIGQTFSMVASGNADVGFVALSQIISGEYAIRGSTWTVPAELHEPIRQDAVLLKRGETNPAALALMALLRKPSTREKLKAFGYR
jgi:molybdate transport system substrate-binding protein